MQFDPILHSKTLRLGLAGLMLTFSAFAVSTFKQKLNKERQMEHALSRLTFGARPGHVERVQKLGVKRWIEMQLNPASIPENPELEAKLAAFPTLSMSTEELALNYPNQQAQATQGKREDGRKPLPPRRIGVELTQAKLLRAVLSERQLSEVLTDFWFNHFNVFLDKGADRWLTTAYERDAIRPHVLGRFGELLKATAQSPAMLFYLDNWTSITPAAGERLRRVVPKARARGINENYARELMELHTLGVDGGYTQKDVQEVARCFTGWTIDQPLRGGKFRFAERAHDKGEKTVLGVTIPAGGGMEDGLKVIEILSRHPSTAKFISRKLAQRFVADEPPVALVERMAATYRKTDGDLKAVLQTMFKSNEFFSTDAYKSKMKSPLEMVAGALRATDAKLENTVAAAQAIANMGQPLYRKQEPTGYSNNGEDWLNSAGLLARINFAVALSENKFPGVKIDRDRFSTLAKDTGAPEWQRR